jgi:predicted CXXCH cytochrome family protein
VHGPVADGECGTCHDPHGSDFPALLPANITETCLTCHETDAAFYRVHKSRAIATSTCTSCHDPHGSGRKGLMRTNQHQPFASGSCEACHGTLTDTSSFTVADTRALCERCHREAKDYGQFAFRHNLDHEGSCNQCHNPHASNVAALLQSSTTTMCNGCHFDEPTRPKPRAAYVTHDGMDCGVCHEPHGADNAKYLKAEDGSFCWPCHEQAHKVSHPVGPNVINARTGEVVTCLSCHQLHGADFDWYLPLDPTRDLCIQCHRR